MRGMVITALSDPAIATRRVLAVPFGAVEPAEWSLAALALASVGSGLLEPDPEVDWSAEKVAAFREALATIAVDGVRA